MRPATDEVHRPARAVVFDVDGTLADTERLSDEAWTAVLRPLGIAPTDEDRRRTLGLSFAATRDHYAAGSPSVPDAATLWSSYAPIVLRLIRQRARAFPDARTTLEALRQRGVPLAFASSSPRRRLAATLDALGVAAWGPAVAGDEVTLPKPAPDVYRVAAALIGVPPEQCLAVEDSATGVESALAAGMTVVGVARESWVNLSGAHRVVARLDPERLLDLL